MTSRDSSGSPERGHRPCRPGTTPSRKPPRSSASNAGAREEFNTIFSNPSDNRPQFLRELEPLCAIPHRFLVIEGAIQVNRGGGRLGQYHRNGLIDFLDSVTARFGIQIVHAESRDDAEERVANLAAIHYAYYLAEQQGLGRCLTENDA
jgi:hypothetical protein